MLPVLCVEPTTYPLTLVNVRVCQFIFSNTFDLSYFVGSGAYRWSLT